MLPIFRATIERLAGPRRKLRPLRPYFAEVGLSVFTATAVLALILALLESFFPGSAAPYVSPQAIVVTFILSGALVFLGADGVSSWRTRTAFGILGLAAAAGGFWAAWYYFSAVIGSQPWLPWVAGLAAGLPFWAFGAAETSLE